VPQLLIGTTSLANHTEVAVFGGAGQHQEFLELTGYKQGTELDDKVYHGAGYELFDLRNIHNLMGGAAIRLAEEGDIVSFHQSWRSTSFGDILSRLRHPTESWNGQRNTPLAVAQAIGRSIVVPHISDSLARLESIQQAAGTLLPVVAYPNQQQPPNQPKFSIDYTEWAPRFAQLRHQPTAETLRAWGVPDGRAEAMVRAMLQKQWVHGFQGVTWDTKHGHEERHGLRFADPDGMVEVLAAQDRLDEVHLNLTNDPTSMGRALDGHFGKTHHGRTLQAALKAMKPAQSILIITEVTPKDFNRIDKPDLIEGHRRLIGAILDLAV
jgi:hypothetical protein